MKTKEKIIFIWKTAQRWLFQICKLSLYSLNPPPHPTRNPAALTRKCTRMHYSEMFRSIYLPIAAIIYLPICLSIYLQLPLSIFLSVYLSTYSCHYISFYLFIYLSIAAIIYLSICLSIYLFINIIFLSFYLCVPEKCPISPIKYFCLHQNCNKLHIHAIYTRPLSLPVILQINSRIKHLSLFFFFFSRYPFHFFLFFKTYFSLYIYPFLSLYCSLNLTVNLLFSWPFFYLFNSFLI